MRAYVVWLPVLRRGDIAPAARREARRVSDQRATHFLDPDAKLAKLYSEIIQLPRGLPAWDVYFVFGPKVRWEEKPPHPTYWMHQLGRAAPSELRLNGDQLARVVNGLLASVEKESRKAAALREFSGAELHKTGLSHRQVKENNSVPVPPS